MKQTFRPHPPAGANLFREPERPTNVHIANVDGASRGNPGPASYAVILRGPDGQTLFEIGKYLGRATNNVAEYYALITALDYAAAQHIERLLVRSDSELLVRQMQGRYKVKSPDLRPLFERAQKLARGFAHFAVEHVPRELNRDADELANIALDKTSTVGGAVAESRAAEAPKATAAAATAATQLPARGERRFRARYSAGALHPLAALDLAEGEIVEIEIRKNDRD
jgi:probable phosphoglycerate mutase